MGMHRHHSRQHYPSGPSVLSHDSVTVPANHNVAAPNKQPSKRKADREPGNPDPRNFKIELQQEIGNCLVLQIVYPDCTNYEGRKILVFRGVSFLDVVNQHAIDPHFFHDTTGRYVSPIARFVPTPEGWGMAVRFARMMLQDSLDPQDVKIPRERLEQLLSGDHPNMLESEKGNARLLD